MRKLLEIDECYAGLYEGRFYFKIEADIILWEPDKELIYFLCNAHPWLRHYFPYWRFYEDF